MTMPRRTFLGLGALAALPLPLAQLLPEPHRFLMTAGCAFPGSDSFAHLSLGMQPKRELVPDKTSDRLAYRLAGSLATHGPSLVATMLAPAFSLSRVRRRPELLEQLVDPRSPLRRVPQAPLVVSAACASALSALCSAAPQVVLSYPGHPAPEPRSTLTAPGGVAAASPRTWSRNRGRRRSRHSSARASYTATVSCSISVS